MSLADIEQQAGLVGRAPAADEESASRYVGLRVRTCKKNGRIWPKGLEGEVARVAESMVYVRLEHPLEGRRSLVERFHVEDFAQHFVLIAD